jgi:hypothetical protein
MRVAYSELTEGRRGNFSWPLSLTLLTIGVFAFSASMVQADPPAAPPATRPSHDIARDNSRSGGTVLGARSSTAGQDRRIDFTPEEINTALDFFRANSPNRMSVFKLLPEDSLPRRRIANELTRRYRTIQNFKESSPDLYELLVAQVKLRDDAFKLARDGDTAALHDKASQIVEVTLKTRQIRLDLLEKELSQQKEQLASDESDQTKLVGDEVSRVKDDADRLSHAARWMQNMHDRTGQNDDFADPLADAAPAATVATPAAAEATR